MRVFRVGLSVATAIAMSGATHAATRVMPVHPEREKMSETRRRDLVLDDLKSILTGPSSPTTIATEPYASSEEGLCQRDVVRIKYARKRDDKHDSPMRPIGISNVAVQYHFLGGEKDESWADRSKTCEQLSNRKIYWAYGDGDHHAAGALALLKLTVADVRQNQRFTIDCQELDAREIETSCADTFLSAAEQISSISRRLDRKDEGYEFGSSPYRFKIVRTYSPLIKGGYSTAIKVGYEEIVVTQ